MASWTFLSNILLKVFFPGNFIPDIWRGKLSPHALVLARARDGMDETTSYGRAEGPESLAGIEYVSIE